MDYGPWFLTYEHSIINILGSICTAACSIPDMAGAPGQKQKNGCNRFNNNSGNGSGYYYIYVCRDWRAVTTGIIKAYFLLNFRLCPLKPKFEANNTAFEQQKKHHTYSADNKHSADGG